NASEVSNNVRSITTKSGCKIVFDDNAKSVLVEDPSGNKFFMDGAGNIEVNVPKNMTFTVGEDFNLNVGNNMNATVGNNHTMSVTNDNMLLVQNNHTLEANNYGQTLQGNYNQSIQGKKLVAVTGDMEETSAAYYHTAQSGNVIIQSANISKLLGKKDALVNKTGFQKPRYFIEDVSDKREEKEKPKINEVYYTDEKGNRINQGIIGQDIYLIIKGESLKGEKTDLDLSDDEIDFEYQGKRLVDDILKGYIFENDKQEKIPLKVVTPKN
ncbi:bacteriophage T4 gp5 trimerisation domain-containing protein, partial [Capnocytophaga stomatis]|uniref:bacteriophage T4 gp5 trimerisation domain-containing protein n=1 Tax=Capnocytophaga stomatis TaxID=1848904 RepID=UPI00402B6B41